MIPQGNPDLTAHQHEFLREKDPEQQTNTFWLPSPENPGKPEDHTPTQSRILNELIEIKETKKLNPKEERRCPNQIPRKI